MNGDEALERVIRLACLTEDRAGDEQRALLDVALGLDRRRGRFTTTNPNPVPPVLVYLVENTYDPSEGRRVKLDRAQRRQHDRLIAKWATCPKCGIPMGAHGADDDRCPGTSS